jgi:hypothetical protein
MNSTVLLSEENRQLRGENERLKKNRKVYIVTGGVLTVQEEFALAKRVNIEPKQLFKRAHHVHVVYVAISHVHAQQSRFLIKLVFKVLIDKLFVSFGFRY